MLSKREKIYMGAFLVVVVILSFIATTIKKDNEIAVNSQSSCYSKNGATTTCHFSEESVIDLARNGIQVEGYNYIYKDGKVLIFK